MKNEIDLSIIVITLNTKDFLEKCLVSLRPALKKIKAEVIIIDNASTDGTLEMINKNHSYAKVYKRNKIYSFCENNNYGYKYAKGRYILFLNNDTELTADHILQEMTAWMDSNPKVGLSTCMLLNSDRKTIQGTGGSFPTLFKVFLWMSFLDDIPGIDRLIKPFHPMHNLSFMGTNEDYYKKEHQQDWVTGAFYFVRKKALEKAGVFDEDYSAYVDEVDLSFRINKAGWKTWYLPRWKVIHYGSGSYGSERSFISEMKNIKLFFAKHYPKWQIPLLNVIIKLGCLLRIIVFSFVKPSLVKIYAKAIKTV